MAVASGGGDRRSAGGTVFAAEGWWAEESLGTSAQESVPRLLAGEVAAVFWRGRDALAVRGSPNPAARSPLSAREAGEAEPGRESAALSQCSCQPWVAGEGASGRMEDAGGWLAGAGADGGERGRTIGSTRGSAPLSGSSGQLAGRGGHPAVQGELAGGAPSAGGSRNSLVPRGGWLPALDRERGSVGALLGGTFGLRLRLG